MMMSTMFLGLLACSGKTETDDTASAPVDDTDTTDVTTDTGCDSPATYYRDGDGDGFGTADETEMLCEAEDGWVADDGDCNDNNASIHPDAVEVCDFVPVDNDCDGLVDDDDPDAQLDAWYEDSDGDGYGDDEATAVYACDAPSGMVGSRGDCDDTDKGIYAGAHDECANGIDEDCDGSDAACPALGAVDLDEAALSIDGAENDHLGEVIAGSGDLTGDKTPDLLVGGYAGEVYVFAGPMTGSKSFSDASITIHGGTDIAAVMTEDVDGDGELDVMVAEGSSRLYLGPLAAGTIPEDTFDLEVTGAADAATLLEDFTGDGVMDYAVSDYDEDDGGFDAGAVYIVSTDATGEIDVDYQADIVIYGADDDDHLGESLARAGGDLDGDGLTDLVIGAQQDDDYKTAAGKVYVVPGGLSGGSYTVTSVDAATYSGTVDYTEFGEVIAAPFDHDGDGYLDLAVGTPMRGLVNIFLGPHSGDELDTDADATWQTGDDVGAPGIAIATQGDVDGNGAQDLIVGTRDYGDYWAETGAAFIVLGPSSGSNSWDDAHGVLEGVEADDAGEAVHWLPDWDGDGLPEAAVGAPGIEGSAGDEGRAFLFTSDQIF